MVTPNSVGDSQVIDELLDNIEEDISQLSGDGAYERVYVLGMPKSYPVEA